VAGRDTPSGGPVAAGFVSGAKIPGYAPPVVKNDSAQVTPAKTPPLPRENMQKKPPVPV